MNQEWCCPQGHRWQHPSSGPATKRLKFDYCPICGAGGAPTIVNIVPGAATHQVEPSAPNLASDLTLGAPARPVSDQTLVGSASSGRSGIAVSGSFTPIASPPAAQLKQPPA